MSIVNEKKSNSTLYHNAVIKLLNSSKHYNGEPLSDHELWVLQHRIKKLTMIFDEESVFKSIPRMVGLLINKENIYAKLYLTKQCELIETDITYIYVMGKYMLEALLINVLGSVFNPL